jgi:hypothetical protein
MAQRLGGWVEVPFLIVIGVPDKPALEVVIERLRRYNIDHEAYYEPDHDMGLTAVATVPVTRRKHRKALLVYKLWSEENNG